MDELVKRGDVLNAYYEDFYDNDYFTFEDVIKSVPAVDAVEVVRCKDCKRCFAKRTVRKKQLMRFCMRMDGNEFQVNANDFCSWGERK